MGIEMPKKGALERAKKKIKIKFGKISQKLRKFVKISEIERKYYYLFL